MSHRYNFHWQSVGKKDEPAILFLHGFMGSCNDWRPVADVISDNYFCAAVDLPGHGKTHVDGSDEHYTMDNCAAGLVQWMQDNDLEQPHCIGYSMGGRLALYLAVHYGELFDRFVLESASPGLKSEKERQERREHDEQLAQKLEKVPFDQFLTEWYEQPLFATSKRHPQRFVSMYHRRLDNNPYQLGISLRQMGTGWQPSLWEKLETVANPTLLIAGDRDRKFAEIAKRMASRCPHCKLAIIAGCGHNTHFEDPENFSTVVRQFLESER